MNNAQAVLHQLQEQLRSLTFDVRGSPSGSTQSGTLSPLVEEVPPLTMEELEGLPKRAMSGFVLNVQELLQKYLASSPPNQSEMHSPDEHSNPLQGAEGGDPNVSTHYSNLQNDGSIEFMRSSTVLTTNLVKTEDEDGFKKINHYMVLKELGRGAFGKVKLAADTKHSDKLVAIKVIPRNVITKRFQQEQRRKSAQVMPHESPSLASVSDIDVLALQEVAIMKKLKHPNVVRLLEVIDDPEKNKVCFVMQYIDRGRLLEFDAEHRCKPIDFMVALEYTRQLVSALSYMHNRNIVHRDIKPENILLSMRGRVYLSDFGMSGVVSTGYDINSWEGTPLFMAPEVLRGTAEEFEPKAADVWALGVTLYSMIYGELPWQSKNAKELLANIEETPIEEVIAEKLQERSSNADLTSFRAFSFAGAVSPGASPLSPFAAEPLEGVSSEGSMGLISPRHMDDEDDEDYDPMKSTAAQMDALNELLAGMLHPDPVFRWNMKQVRHSALITGTTSPASNARRRSRSLSFGFSPSARTELSLNANTTLQRGNSQGLPMRRRQTIDVGTLDIRPPLQPVAAFGGGGGTPGEGNGGLTKDITREFKPLDEGRSPSPPPLRAFGSAPSANSEGGGGGFVWPPRPPNQQDSGSESASGILRSSQSPEAVSPTGSSSLAQSRGFNPSALSGDEIPGISVEPSELSPVFDKLSAIKPHLRRLSQSQNGTSSPFSGD